MINGTPPEVPLIQAIQVCAAPKGRVLRSFGLKTDIDFAHTLVMNRVWFSGKLDGCMNVFTVSIPSE